MSSSRVYRVALFSAVLVCICFGSSQLVRGAYAAITTRSRSISTNYNQNNHKYSNMNAIDGTGSTGNGIGFENSITHDDNDDDDVADNAATTNTVNSDLIDKFSWKCANNASCLYSLINGIVQSYKRGETVKLGLFDLVKLPATRPAMQATISQWNSTETGRSISTFVDFISGNAIRIPVGPMVFSIQRADDDDGGDYVEVALLKKTSTQGRRGGGGLFGGGGGGGGLGKRRHQDKKQFQMLIPMYLAATTFGWTLVAAKAVGLLTIKALIISKIAFVVAAMVLVKKFMDNASEKMMYQFPEHTQYMMPYGMDYPIHAMGGAEIATNEMYPAALHLAAASPLAHAHPGIENLGAESNLHPHLADMHNSTQVLAALNAVGLGQKVKREDSWIAKETPHRLTFLRRKDSSILNSHQKSNKIRHPSIVGSMRLPLTEEALALAAATAVAEDDAQASDEEDDDIFNDEENVKDTLQFLGLEIRKRKTKK